MTPLTLEAWEWLLAQPRFNLFKDGSRHVLVVGDDLQFIDTDANDVVCAAYEELHLKPARKDIRDSERDTLPDYGD